VSDQSTQMSNARLMVGGVLGAVLALGVLGLGAATYVAYQRGKHLRAWAPTPALKASRALERGAVIADGDFVAAEVPVYLRDGSMPPSEAPALVGKRLRVAVPKGTLVTPGMVKPLGGERACWLAINAAVNDALASKTPAARELLRAVQARLGPSPVPLPTGEPPRLDPEAPADDADAVEDGGSP
jgi:SAF domain